MRGLPQEVPRLASSLRASFGVSISVRRVDRQRMSVVIGASQISLYPSSLPLTSTPLFACVMPRLFPLLPSSAALASFYLAFERNLSLAGGPLLSTS